MIMSTDKMRLGAGVSVNNKSSNQLHSESAEQSLRRLHAGKRILLAEDEPVSQLISTMQLELVGLKVDLAENGLEALKMAQVSHYDLILMDVQMPIMNGLSATIAIRELAEKKHTPIVAYTSQTSDIARQRCLEAGMNDHVGKPASFQILYEILLKWLDLNGY